MRPSIAILFAAALSACAPMGAGGPGARADMGDSAAAPCFRPQQIVNFRGGDEQNLFVRALGGDVFEARTSGCFDLEQANTITITPAAGSSSRLCVGDSANILVRGSTLRQGPCFARIVRSLSEAEVEALPSRSRP
ncbi:MAG: hypothetical protein KKA16_09210 [Alphaproteobacteria bacterium]|nr:hypothetical protein [Alphaproteobacteria bacterium]MBU2380860.1 hypothetical protein [Alphaproteobacteria bacterium]